MTNSGHGINVTPLIDVLLVLLIIFMVITPVTPRGLEALLPAPPPVGSLSVPEAQDTVVVSLGADLQLHINRQPVTYEDLPSRLAAIYNLRAKKVLYVQAHGDVEFRHVAQVIDIAKGRGIDHVALLSAVRAGM